MSSKLKLCVAAAAFMPLLLCAQVDEALMDDDNRSAMRALVGDTTGWKFGGSFGLNFNQSHFSNWAAGGQDAVSTTAVTSLYAIYTKDRSHWETTLDLAYGLLSQDGNPFIKTDDRIDLLSKYGYQLENEKFYLTGLLNFRTQFAPGYAIVDGRPQGDPVSNFLAPAFSIASLGLDYMPNETFSAYIAPAASKTTIVTVEALAPSFGLDEGETFRVEFGAFARMQYRKDIFENVNLLTRVDLFSNYLENTKNVDVNWETLITFKVNKWLSTTLTTQLIYDDDVKFGAVPAEVVDGVEVTPAVEGAAQTQFRQIFALGLSFTF